MLRKCVHVQKIGGRYRRVCVESRAQQPLARVS